MLGGVTRMTSKPLSLRSCEPHSHGCSSLSGCDHVRVDWCIVPCIAHYGFSYDSKVGWGGVWKRGHLPTVDCVEELSVDSAT